MIVTAPRGMTEVVLQMPRGNLEAVNHRVLVMALILDALKVGTMEENAPDFSEEFGRGANLNDYCLNTDCQAHNISIFAKQYANTIAIVLI